MGLGARVHNHKDKLKKDTNNDTLRFMQKPGTSEENNSMTSHFDVTNKYGKRKHKQSNIDYDKQTQGIKNPHNVFIKHKILATKTFCGGIGI